MLPDRSIDNQPIVKVLHKKDLILSRLKEKGCRITSQRKLLIDIILENECSCCKEIYYQALEKDPSVGVATVYRMVKTLEEIGAIDRKNLFSITCGGLESTQTKSVLFMDEGQNKMVELEKGTWYEELNAMLIQHGFVDGDNFSVVIRKSSETENEIVDRNKNVS